MAITRSAGSCCVLAAASALAILTIMMLPSAVDAHGYMTTPRARNYSPTDTFYDDQSGNGAGSPVTFNPNPGMCGDPFQGYTSTNFAGQIGAVQATYNAGQTINIAFTLTANHGGKINVKLCPNGPNSISQACFNSYVLRRADTGTTDYWLTSGTYMNSPPYSVNYVLPSGVSCPNGCVLQWEYVAMQSCIENCSSCGDYAVKRNPITNQSGMPACPTSSGPEIFRNCADIKINGSGTTTNPGTPTGSGGTCVSGGGCGAGANCRCPSGECCSQYNYCGTTTAHCGSGCQSSWGTCAGSAAPTCPSGGQCGASANCRCPSGQCCSQYNYCGTTSAHCGSGCQSSWGTCY